MAIWLGMLTTVFRRSTRRHGRVEAFATFIMWFAAGAFVTSTIGPMLTSHEPGQLIDAAGGAAAAVAAIIFKAL
jgi:hypothetical protein